MERINYQTDNRLVGHYEAMGDLYQVVQINEDEYYMRNLSVSGRDIHLKPNVFNVNVEMGLIIPKWMPE